MHTRSLEIKKKLFALLSLFIFAALLASVYTLNNKTTDRRSRASDVTVPQKEITVTIDFSKPESISRFTTGITQANNSLQFNWGANNEKAVSEARNLVKEGVGMVNQNIIGWGALDPWPDPSIDKPTKWDSLDKQMQVITESNAIPMLTLASAPWWMKGVVGKDGKIIPLQAEDEWTEKGLSARILDNKIEDWLRLVDSIATRYMSKPYNVRYFQIWRQLKGYYNEQTQNYDYSDSAGIGGTNITHGYTYLYNKTYTKLSEVIQRFGIPRNEVQIGGPGLLIESKSDDTMSPVHGDWGGFDTKALNAIEYWIGKKTGADFISIAGNNFNKDYKENVDDFKVLDKFTQLAAWINEKTNSSLPIWWSEWYLIPTTLERTPEVKNTLAAYFCLNQVKLGTAGMLSWNDYSEKPQLWTQTTANGGKPTSWYETFSYIHKYFSPGTELYGYSTTSDDIQALVSSQKALFVNTKSYTVRVRAGNQTVTIPRYGVKYLDIQK